MLKELRERGFNCVLYEAGQSLGGTWRWNRYPGARVDSETPEYEFSWPEVWKDVSEASHVWALNVVVLKEAPEGDFRREEECSGVSPWATAILSSFHRLKTTPGNADEKVSQWTWSTNYPDYRELRAYFDHVDRVLDIKKDCAFETVVVGAQFDTQEGKWHVDTADGRKAKSKYFVVAAGFVSGTFLPIMPTQASLAEVGIPSGLLTTHVGGTVAGCEAICA